MGGAPGDFLRLLRRALLGWHPYVYAEMLAAKLKKVGSPAYLVNTGWTGGAYGAGSRMSLKDTRQLIDAIHDGSLEGMQWEEMPIFGLQVPSMGIKDVPLETLQPQKAWQRNGQPMERFQETAIGLANLFKDNFAEYADLCAQKSSLLAPRHDDRRRALRRLVAAPQL